MSSVDMESLTSAQLLSLCASRTDLDVYWEELCKRFNNNLTRVVFHVYQRYNRGSIPSHWLIADLLQEIYLKLLSNKCLSLRNFRGKTSIEADIYMNHIAANVTIDYLRREHSQKRHAKTESIDECGNHDDTYDLRGDSISAYTDDLALTELVSMLRTTFRGKNSDRNILLFYLHYYMGMSFQELYERGFCSLKPTSIGHTLLRMRSKLKEQYG